MIWPKRVLSWWWSMLIESGTRPSTSGSAIRLSFAQSSASRTRSATSSGQRPLQVRERHEAVLLREWRVTVQDHDAVLAQLVERELRRKQ